MSERIRNIAGNRFIQMASVLGLAFFAYTMGIIGILSPETREKSLKATPYIIVLGLVVVLFFERTNWSLKTVMVFIGIALAGYLIEVIGIHTRLIFGPYTYGDTLGFSLLGTPLVIGVNWLFLVYCTASLVDGIPFPVTGKIILASLGMMIYDMVLEPVAVNLNMWSWNGSVIPVQNYLAWFLTALVLHTFLKWSKAGVSNPVAPWVLACQFLFFLVLRFALK